MARTKPRCVPFFSVPLSGKKILREEFLEDIASFVIAVPIFSLKTSLGRNFKLHKDIADVVVLIGVCSKPVRLLVKAANAEG